MIDTSLFSWKDISIRIGGAEVVTAQDVSYKDAQAKEAVYGKGNDPIAIQRGQKSYTGNITMTLDEYQKLLASIKTKCLLDVAFNMIVCYGDQSLGNKTFTDVMHGCEVTDGEIKFTNKDNVSYVSIPFICLRIEHQK